MGGRGKAKDRSRNDAEADRDTIVVDRFYLRLAFGPPTKMIQSERFCETRTLIVAGRTKDRPKPPWRRRSSDDSRRWCICPHLVMRIRGII
jgi:hypothetical protein